jgi:hypothetical protein
VGDWLERVWERATPGEWVARHCEWVQEGGGIGLAKATGQPNCYQTLTKGRSNEGQVEMHSEEAGRLASKFERELTLVSSVDMLSDRQGGCVDGGRSVGG